MTFRHILGGWQRDDFRHAAEPSSGETDARGDSGMSALRRCIDIGNR
jgi:hypothetical protein